MRTSYLFLRIFQFGECELDDEDEANWFSTDLFFSCSAFLALFFTVRMIIQMMTKLDGLVSFLSQEAKGVMTLNHISFLF